MVETGGTIKTLQIATLLRELRCFNGIYTITG